MSQIIIELNEIIPELDALELLLLKTIYTSNIDGFNALCSAYDTKILLVLKSLENKAYIKINGDSFDKYFYREKAVELFGEITDNFAEFWDLYHTICKLPKTDLKPAKLKWNRLTKTKKKLAIDNIRAYYNSLNDKKYCKKARTYLETEAFMDEFKAAEGEDSDWTIDRA